MRVHACYVCDSSGTSYARETIARSTRYVSVCANMTDAHASSAPVYLGGMLRTNVRLCFGGWSGEFYPVHNRTGTHILYPPRVIVSSKEIVGLFVNSASS